MIIIKKLFYRILVFIVIAALGILLFNTQINYIKYKQMDAAYYKSIYNTAFEQIENAIDIVYPILENKESLSDKDILSGISNLHAALQSSFTSFKLMEPHFSVEKRKNSTAYMQELVQLYDLEVVRLQDSLLQTYQRGNYDEIRTETFERLSLMHSDLELILEINNRQFASFSYDEVKLTWIQLAERLQYKEVINVYKQKYPDLFDKKHFFIYNKKLMQSK